MPLSVAAFLCAGNEIIVRKVRFCRKKIFLNRKKKENLEKKLEGIDFLSQIFPQKGIEDAGILW